MEVAHVSAKRSLSPRSIVTSLWSIMLAWILPIPKALITGAATQVIEMLPNKHYLFNIIGEIRMVLSFINGFIDSAPTYRNLALGQRIPCPTRPIMSKHLKVKLIPRIECH